MYVCMPACMCMHVRIYIYTHEGERGRDTHTPKKKSFYLYVCGMWVSACAVVVFQHNNLKK